MFSRFKNHIYLIYIIFFFILIGCQFQEPSNNHGIVFLENRSNKLVLNQSNVNDVIKLVGEPHSKSISDKNEWYYFERVLSKGEYHKLGKNILKTNNILVLNFDKYGVLKNKNLLDMYDKKKISFSTNKTQNDITRKSFAEKFLNSIKEKMYGNK